MAIAAGRKLADRLFSGDKNAHLDYSIIPTVIFSHPTIGSIGLSEAQARRLYTDSKVTAFSTKFVNLFFSVLNSKQQSRIKMVCVGSEERVVGLHIIGHGADEMLQGFAVAMKMGACKQDFNNTLAIHPTGAEEVVTLS